MVVGRWQDRFHQGHPGHLDWTTWGKGVVATAVAVSLQPHSEDSQRKAGLLGGILNHQGKSLERLSYLFKLFASCWFLTQLLECCSTSWLVTWLLKISISKKKCLPLAGGLVLSVAAHGSIFGILKHNFKTYRCADAWVLPPEILT